LTIPNPLAGPACVDIPRKSGHAPPAWPALPPQRRTSGTAPPAGYRPCEWRGGRVAQCRNMCTQPGGSQSPHYRKWVSQGTPLQAAPGDGLHTPANAAWGGEVRGPLSFFYSLQQHGNPPGPLRPHARGGQAGRTPRAGMVQQCSRARSRSPQRRCPTPTTASQPRIGACFRQTPTAL
jgi:hypothetical protein